MPAIPKFYSGRSVFITGGSGFLGKQIIEKLLRSCSEIENVYMLIRPKKGMTVEKRLEKMLNSPIFGRIQQSQPDFGRKIIPIAGDVGLDNLGISDADSNRLEKNVSVVMHSAATVNFTEPLRVAVNLNVLGVQRIIDLSKQLKKLDALVHVSTGYTQVDKKHIGEQIYEPPVTPERIVEMIRTMTDDELAVMTPYLLKKHKRPNTYTLTKSIAEWLVHQEHGNVPTAIIRPTIVCAALRDPFPGWLDNLSGANGVNFGVGVGVIRTLFTNKVGNTLDVIPVDAVAHAVITAGWRTAEQRHTTKDVTVYNMTDKGTNSIYYTLNAFGKFASMHPSKKLPIGRSLFGFNYWTANWTLHRYWRDVYIPARCKIIDMVLRLSGKKPRMWSMYEHSSQLQDLLMFFTTNGFIWDNDNCLKMLESMDESDQKEFDFDIRKLDLDPYYRNWWFGIKKYILKEDVPELDAIIEEELKTSPAHSHLPLRQAD